MKEQKYTFYADQISHEVIEYKGKKKYYITGFISTQDIDIDNDLVTQSGMNSLLKQLNDRKITTDWDHDVFLTDNNNLLPTGKIVESKIKKKEDTEGIWVKVELNPSWKRFDANGAVSMSFSELWQSITTGFTNAFSIAFRPIRTMHKMINGVKVRLLDELKLLNVAITGMPVNPNATILSYDLKGIVLKAINELNILEDTNMTNEDLGSGQTISEPQTEVKHNNTDVNTEILNELKSQLNILNTKLAVLSDQTEIKSKLGAMEQKIIDLSERIVFKSVQPEEKPELKNEPMQEMSILGMIR